MARHPLQAIRMRIPFRWSRRTVILLVMQTVDAAMHLRPRRKLLGRGVRLQTEQDPDRPNPIYLPAAAAAARWFARRTGGIAQSAITESIQNVPTTAHILGGAVIGVDAESGVVDSGNRVFGYENLLVTDGASIPANPGVNPSLTIAAKAEHALSLVPARDGAEPRDLPPAARPAGAYSAKRSAT
jgi:cholesterol oxidase